MFLGVDALLNGRDRSHSLVEDVRGTSCCPDSYYIRIHCPWAWKRMKGGGGKMGEVDSLESLERERKLKVLLRISSVGRLDKA